MTRLRTIGYQGATLDAFIRTLKSAGIATLIDVRDAPVSRKPGFSKRALADALRAAGIAYVHLKPLGNPKPGRDAARSGDRAAYQRIYRAHIAEDAGRAAVQSAIRVAQEANACLMCFERDPAGCHRSIVVEHMGALDRIEVTHLFVGEPDLFA